MTKKEATQPPPLIYIFEKILCGEGLFMDAKGWRERKYAFHIKWVTPLLDIGAIVKTGQHPAWPEDADRGGREQFNCHEFAVTQRGRDWWAHERVAELEQKGKLIFMESILDATTGKGIGSEIQLGYGPPAVDAGFKGIRDGHFTFIGYFGGYHWRMTELLTVSLTAQGMHFFDSMPRLILECA